MRESPSAVEFRRSAHDTDSYRVIFSEADLLPGLIVDKYNDVLAMQALTQAFDREDLRQVVLGSLCRTFSRAQPARTRRSAHPRAGAVPARESQMLRGERSSTVFTLNGVRFHFDGLGGQKTGAFLDQRENYAAAARYAHGEALDVFTYQGGFALHLARVCEQRYRGRFLASRAGSRRAERAAQSRTASLRRDRVDRGQRLRPAEGLRQTPAASTTPSSSTRRRLPRPSAPSTTALRGYKELNLRALKMLRPGGVLVTCSCSFHVSEAEFLEMLGSAAADAGRRSAFWKNAARRWITLSC